MMFSFALAIILCAGNPATEPHPSVTRSKTGSAVKSAIDYPITPVPLRKLCDSADLIAVVVPGKPYSLEQKDENDWGGSDEVELTVLEILKGGWTEKELRVQYSGNMICPSPARFEEGKTHLVFLRKKEDDTFAPCALSYGSKELQPAALRVYIDAINECFIIDQIESKEKRRAAMQEWIVKLAENPHTRWEGAFELNSSRYLPTKSSKDTWAFGAENISADQKERLLKCLDETRSYQHAEQTLFDALAKEQDPRLLKFVIRMIDSWEKAPFSAGAWIYEAIERTDNPAAKKLFHKSWSCSSSSKNKLWWFTGERGNQQATSKAILELIKDEI